MGHFGRRSLECFSLGESAWEELVPCRLCGEADDDGHPFWDCTYFPLVQLRENREFDTLGIKTLA